MPVSMNLDKDLGGNSDLEETKMFNDESMVSLQSLSDLTGFPIEFLKNELLIGNKLSFDNKISMDDLRKAMCFYLNSTMLDENGNIDEKL